MSNDALFNGPGWWLAAAWWLALGGIVGSFLNVVVYRLPRGKSLVWPGSHCPACNRPIRWHDNVPVLGWLLLGGRCRDCGAWISLRYPLVEALTALVFLSVGLVESLSGGVNLPGGAALGPEELAAMTVFHLVLLATLLPGALMQYDAARLPWTWALPAMVVGLVAPALAPWLHPVPAGGAASGFWTGMIGLLAGGVAGGLAACVVPRAQRAGTLLAALLAGLFLGWQLAVPVVLAAGAGYLASRLVSGRRGPPLPLTAWLAVLCLGGIIFWRPLAAWWGGVP